MRGPAPITTGKGLLNTCNIMVYYLLTLRPLMTPFYSILRKLLSEFKEELHATSVRRLTFLVSQKVRNYPKYFTFRGPDYQEDKQLPYWACFWLSSLNLDVCQTLTSSLFLQITETFMFMRLLARMHPLTNVILPEVSFVLANCVRIFLRLNTSFLRPIDSWLTFLMVLRLLVHQNSDLNHIFINFFAVFPLEPQEVKMPLVVFWRDLVVVCGDFALLVLKSELYQRTWDSVTYPLRALINNVSGFVVTCISDQVKNDKGEWIFKSLGKPGNMHLRSINTPYPTKESLQPKRYKAHLMGSLPLWFPWFVPPSCSCSWKKFPKLRTPEDFFSTREPFLIKSGRAFRDSSVSLVPILAVGCLELL